jgi:predicted nucleic acid-binding protein
LSLVIDASVALCWFFADEKNNDSDQILAEVYRSGAIVPALWPIEVANALTMGLRRKRLSEEDWFKSISTPAALPVTVEPLDHPAALVALPPLVKRHHLTFYDALYLELAMRLKFSLASFDKDLLAAARAENLRIWQGN